MENSIEKIWKDGFLKGDALVAPKVNNLYNQKSQNLIDRFLRKFKLNLVIIVVVSAIVTLGGVLLGALYASIVFFALFMGLVWFSRAEMKALEEMDKGSSSYDYLKSFRNWLETITAKYKRFYRFFYPVFFIVFGIGMWRIMQHQGVVEKLLEKFDLGMWHGIPLWFALPLMVVAILFGVYSGYIYKEDLQIIYGPEIRKLDEMIADMEELRK